MEFFYPSRICPVASCLVQPEICWLTRKINELAVIKGLQQVRFSTFHQSRSAKLVQIITRRANRLQHLAAALAGAITWKWSERTESFWLSECEKEQQKLIWSNWIWVRFLTGHNCGSSAKSKWRILRSALDNSGNGIHIWLKKVLHYITNILQDYVYANVKLFFSVSVSVWYSSMTPKSNTFKKKNICLKSQATT